MADQRVQSRDISAGPKHPTEDLRLWMSAETHILSSKSCHNYFSGCLRGVVAITLMVFTFVAISKMWFDGKWAAVFIITSTLIGFYSMYSLLKSYSYFIQSAEHNRDNQLPEGFCRRFFQSFLDERCRIFNCQEWQTSTTIMQNTSTRPAAADPSYHFSRSSSSSS